MRVKAVDNFFVFNVFFDMEHSDSRDDYTREWDGVANGSPIFILTYAYMFILGICMLTHIKKWFSASFHYIEHNIQTTAFYHVPYLCRSEKFTFIYTDRTEVFFF